MSTRPEPTAADAPAAARLDVEQLRWRCDPASLPFASTADIEPLRGIVGQPDALEALAYGLETFAPGQHVYVRGLAGTGRLTAVSNLLEQVLPACPVAGDLAYVHNFQCPDRPRLLRLPRGRGEAFRDEMEEFAEFVRQDLVGAMDADAVRERHEALEQQLTDQLQELTGPFEKELQEQALALVQVQIGSGAQLAMLPVVQDEPAPPERLEQLHREGVVSDADVEAIHAKLAAFSKRLGKLQRDTASQQKRHAVALRELYKAHARVVLGERTEDIAERWPHDGVAEFLAEAVQDLVEHRLRHLKEGPDFTSLYLVNVVLGHGAGDGCPIVVETNPTAQDLIGSIERPGLAEQEGPRAEHLQIRAGALLRAHGGYLILEARDVLGEPGAWQALVRTLRARRLEISNTDQRSLLGGALLKPDPIPLDVKVVLLGDALLYSLLDGQDPDFPHLFKVLADFEDTIARSPEGLVAYAGVLARVAQDEQLPDFEASAVAVLAEHGARIAARQDRLTTRFGRLMDLAREAAFLARKATAGTVVAAHVLDAIARSRSRGSLPARRFRDAVVRGTIGVATRGAVVGQVNGLAVIGAGPLTYGFPARLTATIGPGTAGAINIEREASLSGAIHTKGFYILGGLLRHLLRADHPQAFSASIAFEQSYGGIDGDSASGAEVCCLLSALTGVPLRQDLAITGAIDQFGRLQPIGAATEKVEGFFDTCEAVGLTGTQGVILPLANVESLMLRPDVVAACEAGRFHVYAVDTIQAALELFSGCAVGQLGEDGRYPQGTLLRRAVDKSYDFWRLAARPDAGERAARAREGC